MGLWYHYLATGDDDFIRQMWPTVEKGISFTLGLQQPSGEIYWALDSQNNIYPVALLASSSCVWQSLQCAIKIAGVLGFDKLEWRDASRRLARAIKEYPELFQKSGDDNYDYAMGWYYPVLTGVIGGEAAQERIQSQWSDFVIEDWGCKCVIEEPWWVTVAETCELSLALTQTGENDKARLLLDWILRLQDSDGLFWTGMKLPEEEIWPPHQKPTWASAAVVMAVTAQLKNGNPTAMSFREQIYGQF